MRKSGLQIFTILFVVFIAVFFMGGIAIAQERPALPDDIGQKRFITLTVENDSIGGRGTDQNYTSGVRLSLLNTGANIPAFIDEISSFIPTFDINKTTSLYYSLGHNLYTPDDVTQRLQDPKDRPWAAFLYGSAGMASLTDSHVDELEITLGVIGPLAQGEKVQKFVHEALSAKDPKGWDNELENEPGLILSWNGAGPIFTVLSRADIVSVLIRMAGWRLVMFTPMRMAE